MFDIWQKNFGKKKTKQEKKTERQDALENAFAYCNQNGQTTIKEIAEYMGKSEDTLRRYINENKDFWCTDGVVGKVQRQPQNR